MTDPVAQHIQSVQRSFTNAAGCISGNEFSLVKASDNRYWLYDREGEGMTLSKADLDQMFQAFYIENF